MLGREATEMMDWLDEQCSLVLAVLAVVVLGCLVFIGLDFWRARRHKPRWGWRFVALGLAASSVVWAYFAVKRYEIWLQMRHNPRFSCYTTAIQHPTPARLSADTHLGNLQSRLNLLRRIRLAGRLRPEVMVLRLQELRAELAVLSHSRGCRPGPDLAAAGSAELLAEVEKEISSCRIS
jgi:hypothetical protein